MEIKEKIDFNVEKSHKIVKRTSKYELLRFLAAFMVIAFHSAFGYGRVDWLYTNFNTFLVVPIIIFLFMSGYFLVNAKSGRVIKFLAILLVYYLFNIIVSIAILMPLKLIPEAYTIKQLVTFGWGPWWYFWALPFLYLLVPVINLALQKINKWYMLLIGLLIYFAYYFYGQINYATILVPSQLLLFIPIYIFGGLWKLHGEQLANKKITLFVAIGYLIIIQVINNILFATIGKSIFMYMDNAAKDTSQPLTVLAAWAIFIIFQNINIKYNKIYNFLGKLSLPIYLFQAIFMTIVGSKIMPHFSITNPIVGDITFTFFSFILTTAFACAVIYPLTYLIKYCDLLFSFIINLMQKKLIILFVPQKSNVTEKTIINEQTNFN